MYKAIQNDMVRQAVSGYYALQVLLHLSLNYRVEQRTESPTLLPTVKPLFIREKKKITKHKNIGKKHFGAFKRTGLDNFHHIRRRV